MVSVLAFKSDDPNSNPNEVYIFYVTLVLKGGRHSSVDSSAPTILRPRV